MSFYNMLFGKNSYSTIVLAILGMKECDIERFRDCSIDINEKQISIYTRTGGGNRDDYPNEILTSNKNYKYDEDDDFDSTYATYYFNIPEEIYQDVCNYLDAENKGISAKFLQWINKTLNRPETEDDKYAKAKKYQMDRIIALQSTMDVSDAFNGHTVIPLSDRGMQSMLAVIEDNDGEFVAYWNFLPYKFKILQNESRWTFDKNKPDLEQDKVRIGIDIIWEQDQENWDRWVKKFGKKYPKSIAKIQEQLDKNKK